MSAAGNSAQQTSIIATGTLPDGGDNNAARVADAEKSEYLPPNPEDFTHDADGNLTQDGRWQYTWDAENRLIEMETLAIAYNAGAPRQKLEFGYDSQGRRFSKKVYDWDSPSSSFLLSSSFLYLYDGWNLIAELKSLQTSPFTLHASYTWGLDLSGSMQGAGGVGGLLAVTNSESSTYYPSFDGNGNVMGYYDASSGENVATYEYGPFGELIRETGTKKDGFNFRFSTKYQDAETGLLYYGFRFYDPTAGRWPSRDPIAEQGGLNLYGMVGNDPINRWDYLGLKYKATAGRCNPGDSCFENIKRLSQWARESADRFKEVSDPVWKYLARNNHDLAPGQYANPNVSTSRDVWLNHLKQWTNALAHASNCLAIVTQQYANDECDDCDLPPGFETWMATASSELQRQSKNQPGLDLGWSAPSVNIPTPSLGYWGNLLGQTLSWSAVGATTGASGALILGQAGPQVAAPEEVVTVPAGGVLGVPLVVLVALYMDCLEEGGSSFYEVICVDVPR